VIVWGAQALLAAALPQPDGRHVFVHLIACIRNREAVVRVDTAGR